MKTNAVVEFIKAHPSDWRALLTKEPYNLTIKCKEDRNLFIFNYNQITSDFKLPEVCQARGLILRVLQLPDYPELDVEPSVYVEVCCWPFDKFFNYGEPHAAVVDWNTARVQAKIDGSIIKYWYDTQLNRWQISTNGMIDAFECNLQLTEPGITSFGELFIAAAGDGLSRLELTESTTYIFELVSPYNRVVVPYKRPDAIFIGARDNRTGREIQTNTSVVSAFFQTPKLYNFSSKEDMIATTTELPYDEEGYVVCDASFNRIKVKGLAYLRMHRLKDANGQFSNKRVFEIVKAGESEEVLAYFPEHRPTFQRIAAAYDKLLVSIAAAQAAALGYQDKGLTKKEFAEIVKRELPALRPYMFATWDGKDIQPYLDKISVDDI